MTSFFDQLSHPECEFFVVLGSIKSHEELDKNLSLPFDTNYSDSNFDFLIFLKVNETKIQKKCSLLKRNGTKTVKNEVWIHSLVDEHFFWATRLPLCNFIFPLKSLCKENILTNQMKMILSEVPNQIFGRSQTK